jgi:hypothetical protein
MGITIVHRAHADVYPYLPVIRLWLIRGPVYREVIDWSKVEQLTAEND